jgi:hypothetical protein
MLQDQRSITSIVARAGLADPIHHDLEIVLELGQDDP